MVDISGFIIIQHGHNKSLHDNLNDYVFKHFDVAICFVNRKSTITISIDINIANQLSINHQNQFIKKNQ